MTDPRDYSIEVQRRQLDGETVFEARVRELPDVAEYADSFDEAYLLAVDTIETTAAIFAEKRRDMPPPLEPVDDWSGRITLRLPKSLHRTLALTAEREGSSLNQYICAVLACHTGLAQGGAPFESVWQKTEIPKAPDRHESVTYINSGLLDDSSDFRKTA